MAEKKHQTFNCKQCGAKMEFTPGTNAQVCPYCEFENPIEQSSEEIKEFDFITALNNLSATEEYHEQQIIECPQCAAEITTDPDITSQDCIFCGSPIVATANSKKMIKPKSLLPFDVTDKQASTLYTNWLKGLWFAPNNLKKMARQEHNISGIYVPYWTYDSETISHYTGQRGEYYWVTEHYTTTVNGKSVSKTRQVRKTRWYSASGTVWLNFDDVLVLASTSLPQKYTNKLEPWDLQNLVPYKDEYLSGFKAQSYQVDLSMGFGKAKDIMDSRIRSAVESDIGGDEQRVHSVNTSHDNITFKHLLLPVWISSYRYKEKPYRFLVNARTGEVQGERPYSWVKITLLVLTILIIAATIFMIYQSNHQPSYSQRF
ncbi:MAG: hypothetical protein JEZ07_16415 [Phycisphaerae bacterium]|nr:hypothetical protein [Phycisphaerae bacterium]